MATERDPRLDRLLLAPELLIPNAQPRGRQLRINPAVIPIPQQTFVYAPGINAVGTRNNHGGAYLHTSDNYFYTANAPKTSNLALTVILRAMQTSAIDSANYRRFFEIGGYQVGGGFSVETYNYQERVLSWTAGTANVIGDKNWLDFDLGVLHTCVATLDGSTIKLFRDGTLIYSGSLTWTAPDTGRLSIGGSTVGGGAGDRNLSWGCNLFTAVFGWAASEAEALVLSRNPYSIFEPAQPIWIGSASSSNLTATLSAIEGPDTASFAGNSHISAALSASENSDEASFSANSHINASLTVSESASDAASFSSNSHISVALSASEVLSDTVSFTGNSHIAASLSASELSDAVSFSVISHMSASLSATESATDTILITNNLTAQLVAVEGASDSLSASTKLHTSATIYVVEGADTALFNVTSRINGQLAATEAQSDTFAASSSASIQAVINALEAGSDSLQGAAKVITKANLASIESASDAALFNAVSRLSAVLQTTESNPDTAAVSAKSHIAVQVGAVELNTDVFRAAQVKVTTCVFSAIETESDSFASPGDLMTIVIIVETGLGVADSNSYVTPEEVRLYCSQRQVTLPSGMDALAAMMIKAKDYLEAQAFKYKGSMVDQNQSLQWPRSEVYIYSSEQSFPNNAIPKQLKNAQCALVVAINEGEDIMPNYSASDRVIEERVGPLTTKYADPLDGGMNPILSTAESLLKPLYINKAFSTQRA